MNINQFKAWLGGYTSAKLSNEVSMDAVHILEDINEMLAKVDPVDKKRIDDLYKKGEIY